MFAVALGITAGALLRRTLPAMAVTIGVFTLLRLVVGQDLRWHYLPAVTKTFSFLQLPMYCPAAHWLFRPTSSRPASSRAATAGVAPASPFDGVPIPLSEHAVSVPDASPSRVRREFASCVAGHGYRALISYQPASRYSAFQGIETAIYLVLAAILVTVAAIVVARRDA